MSKFNIMDYIICVAVLCYGIYLTVQNVHLFLVNGKVRKEHLNKHRDGYTMASQYLPHTIFSLGFSVISIVGISMMERNTKDELYTCFTLALMTIVSAGMALDPIVKRRATVDGDGFVCERAHYRFRLILSIDFMKSIIKNIGILTTERQHAAVPKRMGIYLHKCFLARKKRKKNKSK